MATQSRIYLVAAPGQAVRLIRATHPSNALMFVARDTLSVRVATQDDLIAHVGAGVPIEKIAAEQQQLA